LVQASLGPVVCHLEIWVRFNDLSAFALDFP
jgi:hypothetical protein